MKYTEKDIFIEMKFKISTTDRIYTIDSISNGLAFFTDQFNEKYTYTIAFLINNYFNKSFCTVLNPKFNGNYEIY